MRISASTVGCILAGLVTRGVVEPASILRCKPQARYFRFIRRQRCAQRLQKDRKAKTSGELVQIDTLFVNFRPDKAIKQFAPTIPS